jgi:hypothetical protein
LSLGDRSEILSKQASRTTTEYLTESQISQHKIMSFYS